MSTTGSLQSWFRERGIHPEWVACPVGTGAVAAEITGASPAQWLVPTLLESEQRAVMLALVPASRSLEIDRVNALLQRRFRMADDRRLAQVFFDADAGQCCPFAEPYRIPALVDRSLMEVPRVYFRTGVEGWAGSVSGEEFRQLVSAHPKVVLGQDAGPAPSPLASGVSPAPLVSPLAAVQKLYKLPPLPGMALRILSAVRDPRTSVDDLVAILELDPGISAQILRFAASAHFGYRGRIVSLREAINRVLGFELVAHIALGISSTKAFVVPREGPCGLRAFWRHALSSAVLCQLIARRLRDGSRYPPETAYLCGLLHNIGVLLWGHLFPADFQRMNSHLASHPELSLVDYEASLRSAADASSLWPLGHCELGALLLGTWQLPAPIVASCRYHHDEMAPVDEPCIAVVRLANQLLACSGIGDQGTRPLPENAGVALGLQPADLAAILQQVSDMQVDIGELAAALAA